MRLETTLVHELDELAPRARAAITGVIVHRIEVSQEDPSYSDTAADVVRFFREHPIGQKATGGAMPYPLLIARDGGVTQAVPLLRVTPHAKAHNPSCIGVGVIGDFRTSPPTEAQRAALVCVCAALVRQLGLAVDALRGHDQLAGGSSDPNKECPGRHLPLGPLRTDVTAALEAELESCSFIW